MFDILEQVSKIQSKSCVIKSYTISFQKLQLYLAQLWDHPYITSTKGLGGWVKKKARFADVQYRIYADKVGTVKVGGSEKVQNYADIIFGWSLVQMVLIGATHSSEKTVRAKQRLQRPGQKFEFESGESATFKNWWGQAYVICPFQQCTYGTPNAHPITQSLKQVVDSDFVRDWG